MLFRSIQVFIIFLLFASCSGNKPAAEENKAVLSDSAGSRVAEIDTFYCGKNLMCIIDTSKNVFDSFFKKTSRDTNEINNLRANKDLVKRHGDTLIFYLANGKEKKLISTHYVEGMDSFWEYKYIGRGESINYHVIFVQKYEAFSYLLINANSGKETETCGIPAVSPNKKHLACSCFDLQAGFVYNGIEMYDLATDSLTPNWARELSKWGADRIVWMNDQDILAEKMELDSNQNVLTSYIKISHCQRK